MSEIIFNFHDTILIATIFLSSLFVLLILFARHDQHISDLFLAGFFAAQGAISLHLLINYGDAVRDLALAHSPDLFYLFSIAFWLEGPLLFLYTRSLLYHGYQFQRVHIVYFVPSLAYLAYIAATFYTLSDAEKINYLTTIKGVDAPSVEHLIEAIRESLRVFFGVLCIIDIRRAQGNIKDRFSNIEKMSLRWLSVLVIAFIAVRVWILLVVFLALIFPSLDDGFFNAMGLGGNYMTFALVAMMMFYSLQSSPFISGHIDDEHDVAEAKYQPDPKITESVQQYMAESKPYLRHLLNLDQLAAELQLNPRALSAVIKHNFNTNFYEFVNSYRINEAKRILADPSQSHKTMIEIAGECGFNSKATYNTFFKKIVGCTPSEYRSKHNNASANQ